MNHDATFIAYQRVPDGAHGGTKSELEAAIDPWDEAIDEIDRHLGFKEPGAESTHDERADEIEFAAKGFKTMLQFCWDGVTLEPDGVGLRTALRRFVAIAHHLCPDVLRGEAMTKTRRGKLRRVDGGPLTIAQLASQPQISTYPKQLEKMAAEFMARWRGAA